MRTIERNYRKNPHTARFLMAFHTGGTGLPATIEDGNAAEYALAAQENYSRQDHIDDLLDSIPVDTKPVDSRTDGQRRFMEALIIRLSELDAETGDKARTYTDGMTEHGKWTPGRDGNASAWISRMIAKEEALKTVQNTQGHVTLPKVADGRYAVEHRGELKFFKVKNGTRHVFIDRQSSDDLYPVRNQAVKAEILTLIAADPRAAMVRYGRELGVCGHCGRTLTDAISRAAGIGPVCSSK